MIASRLFVALLAVCAVAQSRPSAASLEDPPQVARSRGGMVASADPRATDAGVRMLERGGNAVDAAVAAGFALAVVHPAMTGLGGRVVALVRTPEGSVHGVDGMAQAPAGYDHATAPETRHGYATIAVPGTVAAYARLLSEHGTLSLPDVLAPAIALAEEGFVLRFSTSADHLGESEGSSRYFLKPDGSPYRVGERLVQADLARTLRTIAEKGPDAFYRGEIARQIARDISAHGGYVRAEDLASYRALPLRIVRGRYRGYELVGSGRPPSGYMVIEALQIMDQFDLPQAEPAERAAVVGQAIALAREDRETLRGPDAEKERRMVSRERAVERAAQVRLGARGNRDLLPSAPEGEAHTTHLSAADAKGMVVAMTQSLGPRFGSKVATPGLGFLYAATLGGYKGRIEPGERARLSQSPLLVFDEGRPWLALGAAGGSRIPSAIVNVVARLVDQRLSLAQAVAAARVHPGDAGLELDGAGVVTLEARIEADRLEGTLHQEPGDSVGITGARAGSAPGVTGSWALETELGARLELTVTGSCEGPRASLESDWPLLRSRSSSSVSLDSGTLRITMPPPSPWSAGVAEQLVSLGFETEAVPQVARIHAVAWDAARGEWIGVADPRGRGSARGPTEIP